MSIAARNVIRLLGASAAIIVAAALLTFTVDPLQLFRPARLFAAMYSPDSRMQDAGLIRSQQFDTVFMGTSLAVHFRQSDIDKALGVRSLKLAMTGSNSREQSFVLEAAMERGAKRVIWQMDDWIFRHAPDVDADVHLPANLYRRNVPGVAEYLLSGAMARESLWIALRSIPPLTPMIAKLTNGIMFRFPIAEVDDINALRRDTDIGAAYNKAKALAGFRSMVDPSRRKVLSEGHDLDALIGGFQRDAIGLLAKHPNVQFDIYFAPYSILYFVALRDASPETLKVTYDFTAYAIERLAKLPNVRLYDFRAAREITHDLGNYTDVAHHSPAVDLKILSWLAEGKYRVDPGAPLASLEQLKAQVEAYRVEP
ncbi:hypothetical protein [Bradyrhizobium sp.]|uniref:hypothetical protein n=1 Tax=Bradyrhizobium sp. TaxID=376 RepID=UPI001D2B9F0E|nr:hypothetical protein [Bradyrhizobium sp.]MBI5322594.1 hypothetical protein [Bradyrhizobium sp.]